MEVRTDMNADADNNEGDVYATARASRDRGLRSSWRRLDPRGAAQACTVAARGRAALTTPTTLRSPPAHHGTLTGPLHRTAPPHHPPSRVSQPAHGANLPTPATSLRSASYHAARHRHSPHAARHQAPPALHLLKC